MLEAILLARRSAAARDALLLVLRVALALVFLYHGAGKLFGYEEQGGISGTAEFFDSIGIRPSTFFAYLVGSTEFFGGILVLLGLLTPIVGVAFVVTMAMAIATVNLEGGVTAFEGNLALAGMALTVAVLGPGRISLDALLASAVSRRGRRDEASPSADGLRS